MYVYGMMMGLNINDLVAFMTSPVSELIDQLANPNMFQNESGNAAMAINLAQGIVGVKKFLHGQIRTTQEDIDTGEQRTTWINKNRYVTNYLKILIFMIQLNRMLDCLRRKILKDQEALCKLILIML